MENNNYLSVFVYGTLEKFNEVISKARVRIFYKGLNRNGSYISEEFAGKLINSLPYTPIKGIFDKEAQDFLDHGKNRSEGRIYGFVPSPANFTWEKHIDEDGIEREYACADVLLWTGIYEEAKLIPGKPQSMEIYSKSIKGDWRVIDGQKCFYYTDGCFLGLQALGTSVEPCFEGSEFYSLITSLYTLKSDIEELKNLFSLENNKKKDGNKLMENNFKLSDDAKRNALWSLLNPDFAETSTCVYTIMDVYDDYALAYNFGQNQYERVYYTKDDSSDSVNILEKKKCYILDITEDEKSVLDSVRETNGGTFDKIDEKLHSIEELNSTINSDRETIEQLNANYCAMEQEKNNMEQELSSLREFKKTIETQKKEDVLNKFSLRLDEDIVKKYKENLTNYSVSDLEKELSLELVNHTPEIFNKKETTPLPKQESSVGGIEGILSKYK